MGDAGPVHGMTRGEIVAAVEDDIGSGHGIVQGCAGEAGSDRLDPDTRIDFAKGNLAGGRLRLADSRFGMENLALQVGEVDGIPVGQRQPSDTRRGEVERGWRTKAAGAKDQRMGAEDFLLALDTDLVEQQMSGITKKLLVVQGRLVGRVGKRGNPLAASACCQLNRREGRYVACFAYL